MPESQSPQKPQSSNWKLKAFTRMHVLLNTITFGQFFNALNGREVCFVTMTGAKSGRRLTIPLMYVPYKSGVLLVASMGGAPNNPVWYHSVAKNPDIIVKHRGKKMQLHARLAQPEEKPALWPICDSHYPPYADYRARTTRDIPIFICEPGNT